LFTSRQIAPPVGSDRDKLLLGNSRAGSHGKGREPACHHVFDFHFSFSPCQFSLEPEQKSGTGYLGTRPAPPRAHL
jgi:hypothetical protein